MLLQVNLMRVLWVLDPLQAFYQALMPLFESGDCGFWASFRGVLEAFFPSWKGISTRLCSDFLNTVPEPEPSLQPCKPVQ